MQIIFCPSCDALLLSAPTCPACGWRRPTTTKLWRTETGLRLARPCTPLLIDGIAVLPAETGAVIGIEVQSGKQVWEHRLHPGSATQAIGLYSELILVSGFDTQPVPQGAQRLQALAPASGQELWSLEIAAHSLSAPAADQQTIYFTTSTNMLVALNAQTRRARWSSPHPGWSPAAPALGDGLVVAGGRSETLAAYRADNGERCWESVGQGWFATTPQIREGRVFAWCWDGVLHALDAASGKQLWQQRGERDRGFTSAPLAAGSLVLIGSRVHAPADTPDARYALLAFQADTGAPVWRYPSRAPISVPPTQADGAVLVVNDAGELTALDLRSGTALWRVDKEHVGRRIVAQPLVSGNLVLMADQSGTCAALHWTGPRPPVRPPEAYLKQGAYAEAATAYALQGNFEAAADLYLQLNRPHEAAQLFGRANQPLRAGELWEQVGELRRAAEQYERIGDWEGLTRVLEASGELLRAAQLYEQRGLLAQAARLHEQAGDRLRAAELYEQNGQHAQAQAILDTLDSREKQINFHIHFGDFFRAAIILEQQGQFERAAQLYAQSGAAREELRLRVQLADWQRIAELALQLDEHVQAAEALFQLGKLLEAASAYQRAGETFEQLPDEQRAIAQYDRAFEIYQTINEDDLAHQCRAALRRLRRQPELQIIYTTEMDCHEDRWSKFQFQIENIGHGPARTIKTSVQGMFQIDGNEIVARLAANDRYTHTLSLLPYKEARGSVPIWVSISYQDRYNIEHITEKRLFVNVGPPQISPVSPSSGSSSDIFRLTDRLKTYRENLGILLKQQAQVGKMQASLTVVHNIRESREAIRNIKEILRLRGEPVTDEPEDELDY